MEEVTVEGPSKKDPTLVTGRTGRNTLVHFRPDPAPRVGSYAAVLVTRAATHHLFGELVAEIRPARHRTRIPVAAG